MRRLLATLPILFSLWACGNDATGPSGPFSLNVTLEFRDALIDLSDIQPYLCEYKCIARAEGGEKGEYAEWVSGRLDWLVGDSITYSYALGKTELLDRFGDLNMGRNKRRTFVRSATGDEPFDLQLILLARHSSGEILSDTAVVACPFPADVMNTAQLAGNWTATKVKWTATTSGALWYDLIHGGGSLSLAFQPNGDFTGTSLYPVQVGSLTSVPVAGSISIQNATTVTRGTITFDFTEGPFQDFTGSIYYSARKVYIEATEGLTYDFNRDGNEESAMLEMVFDVG
jgi:hypothetical protein